MRRLCRLALVAETIDYLAQRTAAIADKADGERSAEATRLWGNFRGRHADEVRSKLRRMASGLNRCMYCEDGEGTDIDHFCPKTLEPLRAFEWENHLLACSHCNSNFKRTRYPTTATGDRLLIDPTVDDPTLHLALAPATGELIPLDARGEASIDVFGLNRETCVRGRANALVGFYALVELYARAVGEGDDDYAGRLLSAVKEHPFQGVRVFIIDAAQDAATRPLVPLNVLEVLDAHPNLAED